MPKPKRIKPCKNRDKCTEYVPAHCWHPAGIPSNKELNRCFYPSDPECQPTPVEERKTKFKGTKDRKVIDILNQYLDDILG